MNSLLAPEMKDTNLTDTRHEIAAICRQLYNKGLLAGADGNISVKCGDGTIVATPRGAHKGFIEPEQLVVTDSSGTVIEGPGEVSTEFPMHLAIYQADPECMAIVHTHAPCALALSLAGKGFDSSRLAETEILLGEVAEVPYAPPGTIELARAAAAHVRCGPVFILERHGAVSRGANLARAFQLMECLEHNAKILLMAYLLGA